MALKQFVASAGFALLAAFAANPAQALLTIEVSSPSEITSLTDSGAEAANVFSTSFAGYTFLSVGAVSEDGPLGSRLFDINLGTSNNGGPADDLTVVITQDMLTGPFADAIIRSAYTPTTITNMEIDLTTEVLTTGGFVDVLTVTDQTVGGSTFNDMITADVGATYTLRHTYTLMPLSTGLVNFSGDTATTVSVPEPATLALIGMGVLGAGVVARRRRADA